MRHIIALLFSAWLLLAPPAALASPGEEDIVLTAFRGAVEITSRDAAMEPRAGAVIALAAAAIRTGSDGSVDLRQGDTTIGVGAGYALDFPAPVTGAGAIERVVATGRQRLLQRRVRAASDRLRVETPYLVAVIKGTQFNVAVTPDSSTISLHEGRLEVLATETGIAAGRTECGRSRDPQARREVDTRAAGREGCPTVGGIDRRRR